jgi:hypothetical protein
VSATPFYRMSGDLFEPQAPAMGFWNRSHQNGIAVGGLLALLCDTHQASEGMRTCRLTIDIQRPVPYHAISATCRITRDGGRVQLLDAEITAGGQLVARAAALRVRTGESPPSAVLRCNWPAPESSPEVAITPVQAAGNPIESRVVRGSMREAGPGAYWARINSEIVAGREVPPIARVAMAADLASGPSAIVDSREWSYANLDLSIYLTRSPIGEWIFAESETLSAGNGTAVVNSRLGDRSGYIGITNQVLYMDRRPPRPAAK